MRDSGAPRIFIADASRAVRERLADLLTAVPGARVVGVANDVPSAERDIARTRPHLAILDLQMPGGPVIELISRLRERHPDLRIAVLTAHAAEYRQRVLAAGADFVLHNAREIHEIEALAQIVAKERRLAEGADGDADAFPRERVMSAPLVLNVDDYKPSLYARTRILRRAGYEVIEAATGADTLRVVEQRQPQLVLLDVHLPDMSGLEVCRRIKALPSTAQVAVVHISATYRSERDRVDGLLQSGADAYLMEPIESDALVGIIGRLLDRMVTGDSNTQRPSEE